MRDHHSIQLSKKDQHSPPTATPWRSRSPQKSGNWTTRGGARLLVVVLAASLIPAFIGTSGASAKTKQTPVKGGVATVGIVSSNMPNYIFPFATSEYTPYPDPYLLWNLLWRPLYWEGSGTNAGVNYGLSLADAPVWSDHDQVATIHLKKYKWSDGSQLSPKNVALFMGLYFSEKTSYGLYTPGYFPDDVASVSYDDAADTVTFHLKGSVSPLWFVDNQLTQIYPFPLSWDKTVAGTNGNCESEELSTEMSSCPAVYKYLIGQAKSVTTYATNPLWQVVDGPWKVKTWQTDGFIGLVPNATYSGPVKPKLSEVKYVPFTSDTAEYNELRGSTTLTIGSNVPLADLPPAKANLQPSSDPLAPNYNISPLYVFGVDYSFTNYHNAKYSPLFNQLYFRQALQSTVDQSTFIRVAYRGYGYPTFGPVPVFPKSPYVDSTERHNLYPYSISTARKYLISNGWTIPSKGPAFCSRPGSGKGQCGTGVPAGMKLSFTMGYPTGFLSVSQVVQGWESDASLAGIDFTLQPLSFTAMVEQLTACSTTTSKPCSWQFLNFLGSDNDGIYPGGDLLFGTNGSMNYGDFNNAAMDALIKPTVTGSSLSALDHLENFGAKEIPYPWMPEEAFNFFAVASNLRGFDPYNVNAYENPEDWYFVK
jgi:peptide/nickel transport system substrate-binding protein